MTRRVCTVITSPICKCRSPRATRMPPACDLTSWPLHVTSPRDPCTWPLCSSTQFVELSQLNTSSRFRQKHNFFGVPKIRSISTWRITWLLLFTLSISLDQPSVFTRLNVFTFGYELMFNLIVVLEIDKDLRICFYNTIFFLSPTISLRMESDKKLLFYAKK